MQNSKDEIDTEKIKKFLKEKGKGLAELIQDAGLIVSEVLREKGEELAKTTAEKTADFAGAASKATAEFVEKTSKAGADFTAVAAKRTSEFAKQFSESTAGFAKASSKEFKAFARSSSKATKIFLNAAAAKTKDSALLLRPLKSRERFEASRLHDFLNKNEYGLVVGWLKQGKATVGIKKYDWSFLVSGKNHFPKIISEQQYTHELNEKVRAAFLEERFAEFSERAWQAVPQYVAPNAIGLIEAKRAVALQLFSEEPLHLILIGDINSGKTDIIESVKRLSEPAAIDASEGVCINLTEDKKVRPGVLPRAGKGICIVNKLNGLKREDELILYRTLETGYVSYVTKSGRRRLDSPASILAECNPRHGYFEAFDLQSVKKQLPLDPYLVARFHAAVFTKKVELEKFADIAARVISENKVPIKADDLDFIKRYAEHARRLKVELPAHFADKIKSFAVSLKEREQQLPYKITPQAIIGIIRMAKASARMELRAEIESKDLERVFDIFDRITKF